MAELYECRNCYHIGVLTIHGRCEHCNSEAVISQELIISRSKEFQFQIKRGA